jgi:glyoxylate reductase
MRVYLSRPIPDPLIDRLAAVADVTEPVRTRPPTEAELIDEIPGHDVAVVQLTDPITEAVFAAAAPPLRLVAQIAVGLDNVDRDAAHRHGVTVTHTPGVLTDATADLTLALLLAACRRVVEGDRFVRAGRWDVWSLDLMAGMELRGATLGILGLGRIGRAVAHRAEAFGMHIQHTSRTSGLPLQELIRTSDVLSLHAPLTPGTWHLIDRRALFSMRSGSVLINTARGALVEEDAIADALETGPLRAVGLDVFEAEPTVPPSLLGRDDVVLLPHIGSATERTRHRMAEMAVEAVEAFADGRSLPHVAPP